MSMAVMPEDFEGAYHYRPWLVESFVDTRKYSGACYQASNWIAVGKTKGRGRQDRFTKAALSIKEIYVYPLTEDFRRRIGLPRNAGLGPLGPADGQESGEWAKNEFGGAPLGDARLSKRLVEVAAKKAEVPDRAFSGVAKGDWASVKGYYRMIDQPDESAVNMNNILLPHREQTIRRMSGQQTVLCIQDGSDLNYTNLSKCEGLGVIGKNQTEATSRGLHMHSTFAVAPNGLPLGVVKVQCTARESRDTEDKRKSIDIPIEEKTTYTWIEHHRDMEEISGKMPGTRVVDVCDREADFFELFDEQRKSGRVELLVRAKHDRKIADMPLKLFDIIRQASVESYVRILIPRQSARPKRSKQKARPKRPRRIADLAIRYMLVGLVVIFIRGIVTEWITSVMWARKETAA
jgi:hypothetical protein